MMPDKCKLIGEEIAALGDDGGERDLYFRVIDRSL